MQRWLPPQCDNVSRFWLEAGVGGQVLFLGRSQAEGKHNKGKARTKVLQSPYTYIYTVWFSLGCS